MRLVTGFASLTAGVLRANHLRKRLGLGDVLFMAANAENFCVRQLRNHRTGIIGMLCKRPMAGLAVHARMFARFLYIQHFGVALLTGLVAGKNYRLGTEFGQRVSPVVAILSKALGDEVRPYQQKQHKNHSARHRKPDDMFGIFEFCQVHPVRIRCQLLRLRVVQTDTSSPAYPP